MTDLVNMKNALETVADYCRSHQCGSCALFDREAPQCGLLSYLPEDWHLFAKDVLTEVKND